MIASRVTMSAKRKSPKAEAVTEDESFTCGYCKRSFQLERVFAKHMCAQKQRFLDRDEKHVKLGFWIFERFYAIQYRYQKPRTYDHFVKSQFYTAFVKFARYLLDINAVHPQQFVEFVIVNQVHIDKWQSPVVYETYLRELNKKETPDAALERNFLLMHQWALENDEEWTDFFRKVPPPLAVLWIRSGRISPWVIYTASSAADLFARLSEEQMKLIQQALDPSFWETKLKQNADDVAAIRTTLQEAGI